MTTETKVKKVLTEAAKDRRQRKVMKARAAILSIKPLTPTSCLVWGGEKEHIVRLMPNGQILCDCEGWKHARGNNCSHAMKYRLTYGDLRKDLRK
jgi:hypothetical protein